MKEYTVKAWDGIMEWNAEYYTFEAENETEATEIADLWFKDEYLPETILDPSSYSEYPDEDDYETIEEYEEAVKEAEEELEAELHWEFIESED